MINRFELNCMLVLISVCFCTCSPYSTINSKHDERIILSHRNLRGVVFSKSVEISFFEIADKSRFSPSIRDVKLAEKILFNKLSQYLSGPVLYQNDPFFARNSKNYVRQYVGLRDESKNKIILINFLWNPLSKEFNNMSTDWIEKQYRNDWIEFRDGGRKYWKISINLESETLFNMQVSGGA